MKSGLLRSEINAETLTAVFKELNFIYKVKDVDPKRKELIVNQVKNFGYLPYPHIKALEELSPVETIVGLEEKLSLNLTFENGKFKFKDNEISAVRRAGFSNSGWIKTEQHSIKLINLAGLGNGNKSLEPGRFIDWLKQLLILPSGNIEKGILSTTAYFIPFHPRDFGCAYLPTSSEVSPTLEDPLLKEKLGLNAKEQVKLFLALTQLAGHPIMYDVLPQVGRFSKTILANPYAARWFDIAGLTDKLNEDLNHIAEDFRKNYHDEDVYCVKNLISKSLAGIYQPIPENLQHLADKIEDQLDHKRKWHSNEMMTKQNQEILHKRAEKIINQLVNKGENDDIKEEEIKNQGKIIAELIKNDLWPSPGGAWCSSGVPVFDKMSEGAGFPMFKHYDYKGKDVTEFANLDCQTPFYFVYLENGGYNEKVIDFYVNYLKKIRSDYNFDGFRVDHIDHIVDAFSETDEELPISYRAPRYVLGKANNALKNDTPYFAVLAEYMLWENFYKEYHQDMNFDLLWGNDIISQYLKNTAEIIADNKKLEEYNQTLEKGTPRLSVLKTYNNQDGEFRAIDQYPGQLGEVGALFKLFKFKFLPGGKNAQRPVLYIDGDESFTKTGIEKVIGSEESMKRAKNYEFYRKFNAISRFAVKNDFARYGIAQIHQPNEDESGFISWYISNEDNINDDRRLFIVANENPPTEVYRENLEDGSVEIINRTSEAVYNREAVLPDGFKVVSEYILPEDSFEFEEAIEIPNVSEHKIIFEKLEPSEFHIYKIRKI